MTVTPEQSSAWYEQIGRLLGEDPDDEPDVEETDRDRIDDR